MRGLMVLVSVLAIVGCAPPPSGEKPHAIPQGRMQISDDTSFGNWFGAANLKDSVTGECFLAVYLKRSSGYSGGGVSVTPQACPKV